MRPENSYSRRQVARACKVSVCHVALRLDGHGLTPHKEGGRVWYDRAEADAFVRSYKRKRQPNRPRRPTRLEKRANGDLAARVFALLDEGADFRRIVRETKGDPDEVHLCWKRYHMTFEEREAEKRAEEKAVADRKQAKVLERQRAREEHFARKAREGATARVSPLSLLQPSRLSPTLPAAPPKPEEKAAAVAVSDRVQKRDFGPRSRTTKPLVIGRDTSIDDEPQFSWKLPD